MGKQRRSTTDGVRKVTRPQPVVEKVEEEENKGGQENVQLCSEHAENAKGDKSKDAQVEKGGTPCNCGGGHGRRFSQRARRTATRAGKYHIYHWVAQAMQVGRSA